MNIIILSKNYEKYSCGYYHQDIIDAFYKLANVFIYGRGYCDYNKKDTFLDVLLKSQFKENEVDLIVCSTSWDEDGSKVSVDPHPNINLSQVNNISKVYFLNKEYKKLKLRFEYIQKQKFNLICTVHPDAKKWEKEIGFKFMHLPFGLSLDRFKDFGLKRKYDFSFTGGLHNTHTDGRFMAKRQIFKKDCLNIMSNKGLSVLFKKKPIKDKYSKYSIYWAEWGSRGYLLRSMLPKGVKYAKFLNQSKVFLNTPSAIGIFNTRFLELMATKTLILCPESILYGDVLEDGHNCVMYKQDMSDFDEKLIQCIENEEFRERIIDNAHNDVSKHSYDSRIKLLLDCIGK
jgi:spore maturation protein CgeB